MNFSRNLPEPDEDGNALGNIADQYASEMESESSDCDSEPVTAAISGPILGPVPQAIGNDNSNGLSLSNDAGLLQDESSRDSSDSFLALFSNVQSPRTMFVTVMKHQNKQFNKVIKGVEDIKGNGTKLLDESGARDYLVALTLAQDDEILEHKHMRDVQEGKTAAQTKKANKAAKNEAIALKEAADAKAAADAERARREDAETEKSGLLLSNINMSTSIRNSSAGEQVSSCSNLLFFFKYNMLLPFPDIYRRLGFQARIQ